MGIFGRSAEQKRAAFIERAEELAGSLQTELYGSCQRALLNHLPSELAGKVAAAIANYVCRFGYVNPDHARNPDLMRLFEIERPKVLASLGEAFKSNATGVLIILGAAWSVDLEKFKDHLSALAKEGFTKVGKYAPDVRRELPEELQLYVYEAGTLSPAGEV